jgi:DNA-binding LytR/AlgR family response regulator
MNNAVLNLLCYFGLATLYFRKSEPSTNKNLDNSFTADKVRNNHKKLIVDKNGSRLILPIEKVNYIETSNNCIVIYSDEGKFVKYQSLKKFLEEHNYEPLQRVHKSYAVNINKIVSLRNNKNGDGSLTLSNGNSIKFSRNYNVKQLLEGSSNH